MVIGRLQNNLFILLTSEIHDTYTVIGSSPNFPYIKYEAERHCTKSGKLSYHYVKKSFKTQHGRIPIDPAILAAVGHRFIEKK